MCVCVLLCMSARVCVRMCQWLPLCAGVYVEWGTTEDDLTGKSYTF